METQQKARTFRELVTTEPLVLVDFFAEWCGPCHTMKPILQDVKAKIGRKVRIVKVDVDKNNATAAEYQIASIPTLILFKNGHVVWRKSGVVPPSQLLDVIEHHL